MTKRALFLLCLTIFILSCKAIKISEAPSVIDFDINLNDRSNDTFKVTVNVDNLSKNDSIFQFAATAPGTYKVMDIGRFVSNFQAFNKANKSIPIKKLSVNQFQLSTPERIVKITYEISETFDSPIKENEVYLMCGTSIEDDHALINGQAVFGYFIGKQDLDIRVRLNYPENWKIGTALKPDATGRYLADSYDHIVDSPILLGELTVASSKVGDTDIQVYTFSQNKKVQSDQILSSMKEMLQAADKFVFGLPVDNYTFLYYFDDTDAGAWEHSYSSEYILREDDWEKMEQSVKNIAAHEFFHVITPLNIHSELIEQFNFVDPTPSKHLWLYEATTEWAANSMLLKSGQLTLDDYFELLHVKADVSQFFDQTYSLEDLSLKSYTEEGQEQYVNIYHRGALTMGLLDIELLELSKGEKGLRELIHELINKYGPARPFNEEDFYDEIVSLTYPEVKLFFDNYIRGAKPLPFEEMYAKIGVRYQEKVLDPNKGETGLRYYQGDDGFTVLKCSEEAFEFGFKEGDVIKTVNGLDFNLDTIEDVKKLWSDLKPGDAYTITLIREGETLAFGPPMFPKTTSHVFTLDSKADQKAKDLFRIWSGNL